ncbi:phosphotransferase, partial [Streptomyces hainanensis]
MPTPLDAAAVTAALATHWHLSDPEVTPLPGGMNSATWQVRHGADRRVAKAVPHDPSDDRFHHGLRLAARTEHAGLPSGAAVPTAAGAPTVAVAGHHLALLRWVEGRTPDPADRHDLALVGATLGRAHRLLGTEPVDAAEARATYDPLAA